METFLAKNTKNEMEWDDRFYRLRTDQSETEQNEKGTIGEKRNKNRTIQLKALIPERNGTI